MKKVTYLLTILMMGVLLSTSAYALPTLLTNEITKMKFTNFENWVDNDAVGTAGYGYISTGDKFYGIMTMTSISDVDQTFGKTTWTDLASDEITGIFQVTVTNDFGDLINPNLGPGAGNSWNIEFGMASGDYLTLYYDDSQNFNSATVAGGIASSIDGALWMSVTPDSFYYGFNETSPSVSTNFNWADLTVNNTGYEILPMLWKESLGAINPYGSFTSDLYFETKLEFRTTGEWRYKSEDPVYLYATPEPATLMLLGIGLLCSAGFARRKNN